MNAAALLLALVPDFEVRVVERGTGKPVAGAKASCAPLEIRICDSWVFRIVGDDRIERPREPDEAPARSDPGTASTWIASGTSAEAISDEGGIARFDGSLGEGGLLVAESATLRGARVVLPLKTDESKRIELAVGPRRSLAVVVVGSDGRPVAGVPVEFGRFLEGAEEREHGDDERGELWDRLGSRRITDERGSATLDELELHGADDLDVLRGARAGPFCARALVAGTSRVVIPIDPDAPPSSAVTLKLPPVGRLHVNVTLPDHRLVPVDGEAEVLPPARVRFAPGFPRFVSIRGGRAELFPVEIDDADGLRLKTQVADDGRLLPRLIRLAWISDAEFADGEYPLIRATGPALDAAHPDGELPLSLPTTWFAVRARFLWPDGTPAVATEFEVERTLTFPDSNPARGTATLRRSSGKVTTDAEGRVGLLLHRSARSGELALEFVRRSAEGIGLERRSLPLRFGEDRWFVDLGDVRLAVAR